MLQSSTSTRSGGADDGRARRLGEVDLGGADPELELSLVERGAAIQEFGAERALVPLTGARAVADLDVHVMDHLLLRVRSCRDAGPASRPAQGGGIDRGRHGLHGGEHFPSKEAKALLSLGAGHPPVEQVDDHHLEADGPLQRPDPVDDLVGGADRLSGAARVEARIGDADVGRLALEVLLVALNAGKARVVPLEVVVLRGEKLVAGSTPSPLRLRRPSRRSTSTAAWWAGPAGDPVSARIVLNCRTWAVISSRSSPATNIWPRPFSAASRAEAWVVNAALMRVVRSPLWRACGRMVVGGIL